MENVPSRFTSKFSLGNFARKYFWYNFSLMRLWNGKHCSNYWDFLINAFVLQKCLDPDKNGFVKLNEKWKLSLPLFLVELLLLEFNFGHTHTHKY